MMNLIQKYFNKERFNREVIRNNFSSFFFSLPEHQWLLNAETRLHFEKLFQLLPTGVLETFMSQHPLVFVPSENLKDSRMAGHAMSNMVVVFPEFQKLLFSKRRSAVAYLAHEIAFVLYELEGHPGDTLMAEVEADKFVCDIGLADELEEFLLMLDETIEKRVRLTYLTINHFTGGHQN